MLTLFIDTTNLILAANLPDLYKSPSEAGRNLWGAYVNSAYAFGGIFK